MLVKQVGIVVNSTSNKVLATTVYGNKYYRNQDYARLYITTIGIILATDEALKSLVITPSCVLNGARSQL